MSDKCYGFDGQDSYVEISSDNNLDFGSSSFTVVHWIYYAGTNSSNSYPRITGRKSDNLETAVYTGNNEPEFTFYDGSNWNSISGLTKESWHMLALTWDGSKWQQFIDSKKFTVQGSTPNVSGNLSIGNRYDNWDEGIKGKIAEIRLYNRPLTQNEIQYLYSVGKRGLHTSSKKSS